jgi:transglutaminase-like putative cysteine protease
MIERAGLLRWLIVAATLATLSQPVIAGETRRFELRYEATLETPAGRLVDLWLPLAHDDAQQTIRSLHIEGADGAEVVHDTRYGNPALHLRRKGPLHVVISYVAERREEHHALVDARSTDPSDGVVLARWLKPDRLGSLTPTVQSYTREATANQKTPLQRVRAIYDFVVATMRYDKSGEGWGRGDIMWACDAKRGNCTDFHTLFVAMARSAGIPARFEIGLPLPEARGSGEIPGYHCWARFWLDGVGWIPVDASEAKKHLDKKDFFFGGHDVNRLQFTVGRDLRFPGMAGELNYFIHPYAEVDGKSVPVAYHYTYRDLP